MVQQCRFLIDFASGKFGRAVLVPILGISTRQIYHTNFRLCSLLSHVRTALFHHGIPQVLHKTTPSAIRLTISQSPALHNSPCNPSRLTPIPLPRDRIFRHSRSPPPCLNIYLRDLKDGTSLESHIHYVTSVRSRTSTKAPSTCMRNLNQSQFIYRQI
jgi:hypothetical protein